MQSTFNRRLRREKKVAMGKFAARPPSLSKKERLLLPFSRGRLARGRENRSSFSEVQPQASPPPLTPMGCLVSCRPTKTECLLGCTIGPQLTLPCSRLYLTSRSPLPSLSPKRKGRNQLAALSNQGCRRALFLVCLSRPPQTHSMPNI
jgi:hypothetical protein